MARRDGAGIAALPANMTITPGITLLHAARRWPQHLFALAVAALLAAGCGGGGDSAPPALPAQQASAMSTCNLPNFQAEMLQRVNAQRASGGNCRTRGSFAPSVALQWHGALDQAAAAHSLDMATQNYFAHDSLDGRTPAQRAEAAGYAWRTIGENIAAGYPTVQAVVAGWMASDGHCANLLNPAFRDIGVACVPGTPGSTYDSYWTMDLGAQ